MLMYQTGDLLLRGQDHLAQHGVHRKLSHPATQLNPNKQGHRVKYI